MSESETETEIHRERQTDREMPPLQLVFTHRSLALPASSHLAIQSPLLLHRWYRYILGVSASTDPRVPAPGLFGPFVTWDVNGWNGDYTLDYNYEAAFYGVFGSNHPELAVTYFPAVSDGVPAARRGAASLAAAHNITTCSVNATHFNAHITPWGGGDYDEDWVRSVTGGHGVHSGVHVPISVLKPSTKEWILVY